jgi:hypothetical protein
MEKLMKRCECEHDAHPGTGQRHIYSIHPYGSKFPQVDIVGVRTPVGLFHVCRHCSTTCYSEYPKVELTHP